MKKVDITKEELVVLYDLFNTINGTNSKYWLEFCVKNRKLLEVDKEIIDKYKEFTEDEKQYLSAEYEIMMKYSVQDGEKIFITNDKITDFNKEVEELQVKYKEVVQSVQEKIASKEELLKERITCELNTIEFKHIPEQINTTHYLLLDKIGLLI